MPWPTIRKLLPEYPEIKVEVVIDYGQAALEGFGLAYFTEQQVRATISTAARWSGR